MIEPTNSEKCECGCDTFKIQIDSEYKLLLYECSKCGYIETCWFEEENEI